MTFAGTLMNVVIPRPNPNGKPSPGVGEKFFQIYMNFAGKLVNAFILRPNPNGEPSPGVGKVFLEYADVESAAKALTNLNGRKIGGNSVEAIFYPENKFSQGEYDG
ncbi:hypothetical protein L1049_024027 [Liquidambar formosana]|uniref:RRM domain-containing protein n=1 Tax=Liquidambar formosana TaxID=63359 RepID=A0AAP0RUM3_LIQFO